MRDLKRRALLGLLVSGTVATGCSTAAPLDQHIRGAEAGERRANERAAEELMAFMSLTIAFPDPELRSLADAAGKGRVSAIRTLLDQGVDVDARGTGGATALFWALRGGSVRGFTALLESGADPNVVFDDGGTLMHWAVRHPNPAFLDAALEHGGDANLRAGFLGRTPIFEALGERRDRLKRLLDAGADVNAESELGMPAYVAARRGAFDVVCQLLGHGAIYSAEGSGGETLLDIALRQRGMMDPNHELYRWLERTITWLESRHRTTGPDDS